MPCRKKVDRRASFSFVSLGLDVKNKSWIKLHSSVTRSHAAYWGGPAKHRFEEKEKTTREAKQRSGTLSRTKPVAGSSDVTTEAVPRSRSQGLTQRSTKGFLVPQPLFSLPQRIGTPQTPFGSDLSTLEFCGPEFVRRFLKPGHEDYQVMLNGCTLIAYAHSMGLKSHGSERILLKLKDQVIRQISARVSSSATTLSPQCLVAILALGSPIVCLVSQDLPEGLPLTEYVQVSWREDHVCSIELARTARKALEEYIVHQQAIRGLLSKASGVIQDVAGLQLLQYIINLTQLSVALETAHYDVNILGAEIESHISASVRCQDCHLPTMWTSPLTCHWQDQTSELSLETQMLQLASLVHRWLATFLDWDNQPVAATAELLDTRSRIRQIIELFVPAAATSTSESAAMYECCRWASMIMLGVEKLGLPIHVTAKHIRLRPRLCRRLHQTNLTTLWGKYKGLLFWVSAVCHFATAGQCFPLMGTALFARISQELAMSESCEKLAIKPLKRLKEFERKCCDEHSSAMRCWALYSTIIGVLDFCDHYDDEWPDKERLISSAERVMQDVVQSKEERDRVGRYKTTFNARC